jgi:hypothetical protein
MTLASNLLATKAQRRRFCPQKGIDLRLSTLSVYTDLSGIIKGAVCFADSSTHARQGSRLRLCAARAICDDYHRFPQKSRTLSLTVLSFTQFSHHREFTCRISISIIRSQCVPNRRPDYLTVCVASLEDSNFKNAFFSSNTGCLVVNLKGGRWACNERPNKCAPNHDPPLLQSCRTLQHVGVFPDR